MKRILFATAVICTSILAQADDSAPARRETRTRNLGSKVIAVGACSAPTQTVNSTTILADDGQGNLVSVPATAIYGTSKLLVTKCIAKQDYAVSVTGSFWNSKSSEIEGGQTNRNESVQNELEFNKSQTIKDQKDIDIFGRDNSLKTALTIAEGVKAQALAECEQQRAQLAKSMASDLSCSN